MALDDDALFRRYLRVYHAVLRPQLTAGERRRVGLAVRIPLPARVLIHYTAQVAGGPIVISSRL